MVAANRNSSALSSSARLTGVILGTAVGDAIGLPREGMSRRRAQKIFGAAPLGHSLIGRRGLCSDDTEHTCMVAQALLASRGEPERFAGSLAWRLRFWLLGLPAGVGLATGKAIIKLWLGFGPRRSGVWSAGNGPAMRAAILGVYAGNDRELLRELVKVSTRLTHSDPAAEHGALAVALTAAYGSMAGSNGIRPDAFLELMQAELAGTTMLQMIEGVVADVLGNRPFEEYLRGRGLERGVSGYVNHTVSAAIFAWLQWGGDFRTAVEQVVLAGGDSDTTGAIVGALVGATAGADAIPQEWIEGLAEWPRSVSWMKRLGSALAESSESGRGEPLALFWPGLLVRNVLFLLIVFAHGFRRLLPPY